MQTFFRDSFSERYFVLARFLATSRGGPFFLSHTDPLRHILLPGRVRLFSPHFSCGSNFPSLYPTPFYPPLVPDHAITVISFPLSKNPQSTHPFLLLPPLSTTHDHGSFSTIFESPSSLRALFPSLCSGLPFQPAAINTSPVNLSFS